MESVDNIQHLRSSILSVSPVNESSLTDLLGIFSQTDIKKGEYLSKTGDYSSSFGFICHGIMQSYYISHSNKEVTKNLFIDHMFVLPLPSFIYRSPSYLNFRALSDVILLQAKYSMLEELTLKQTTINKFSRIHIDREWIINKELHESSQHIYNSQTRFRIFAEKYQPYLNQIEAFLISSFLQIPIKQVEKMKDEFLNLKE